MDGETLQSRLEQSGELMVKVEEIDAPIELHLHDTTIDGDEVRLKLGDGELQFSTDRVSATWKHYHTLADYGLGD